MPSGSRTLVKGRISKDDLHKFRESKGLAILRLNLLFKFTGKRLLEE